MENATASTLTERTLHDEIAGWVTSSDALISHELGHQWFGDFVTCSDWADVWLNEGFAAYSETVWWEHFYGKDRAQWDSRANHNSAVSTDNRYRRPMATVYYDRPWDMFDGNAYAKGASVLHMLRYELGDQVFWEGVRRYLHDNGPGPVVSEDLRQAMFDVSGRSFHRFFDQWVYRGGHPELEASWGWNEGLIKVEIRQTQELNDLTPLFHFTIPLRITAGDSVKEVELDVTGADQKFSFESSQRPDMVELDPDNWILKELQFDKSDEEWRYQILHSAGVVSRARAASALGKTSSAKNVFALAKVLADEEEFYGVRQQAASALGAMRTQTAESVLMDNGGGGGCPGPPSYGHRPGQIQERVGGE